MELDLRVGNERQQFSTQAPMIPSDVMEVLKKSFSGEETSEFYEGLLAGYTCAYQLAMTLSEPQTTLGHIVAYLSSILEERS